MIVPALLLAVPQVFVIFTQYVVFTSGWTVTLESLMPIGVDVSSTGPAYHWYVSAEPLAMTLRVTF